MRNIVFKDDKRFALIIVQSNYDFHDDYQSQPWSLDDGKRMMVFLESIGFSVEITINDRLEIIKKKQILMEEHAKTLNSENVEQSFLFLYYYTGHGMIEDSLTVGINSNNQKIPIQEWVRNISKYERTFAIAIFDCDRLKQIQNVQENEGLKKENSQFYILQSSPIDELADDSDFNGSSSITKQFLDHIENKKKSVFPDMIKDWNRPNSNDIVNHTMQVNLFQTNEEILRKNYQDIFNQQILQETSRLQKEEKDQSSQSTTKQNIDNQLKPLSIDSKQQALINDFKAKSLEMDIFNIEGKIIKSQFGIACIMMLDHNLLACQSNDYSIDVIELPNMTVKTTFESPDLELFLSLHVTNDYYVFGFYKGIAKYSKSFQLLQSYQSREAVQSIIAFHNDPSILILGQIDHNIEIVDSNTMTQLAHFQLSNQSIILTYEIKKTSNTQEYAVCTDKGLYFIDITKKDEIFEVVENLSEFYQLGPVQSSKHAVGQFFQLGDNLIAVTVRKHGFVSIIDRSIRQQIKRVDLPMFKGWLLSMQSLQIQGGSNAFIVKDCEHIYLLDLRNFNIYPIQKSKYDERKPINAQYIQAQIEASTIQLLDVTYDEDSQDSCLRLLNLKDGFFDILRYVLQRSCTEILIKSNNLYQACQMIKEEQWEQMQLDENVNATQHFLQLKQRLIGSEEKYECECVGLIGSCFKSTINIYESIYEDYYRCEICNFSLCKNCCKVICYIKSKVNVAMVNQNMLDEMIINSESIIQGILYMNDQTLLGKDLQADLKVIFLKLLKQCWQFKKSSEKDDNITRFYLFLKTLMNLNGTLKEIWKIQLTNNFQLKLESNIRFYDSLLQNMQALQILANELKFKVKNFYNDDFLTKLQMRFVEVCQSFVNIVEKEKVEIEKDSYVLFLIDQSTDVTEIINLLTNILTQTEENQNELRKVNPLYLRMKEQLELHLKKEENKVNTNQNIKDMFFRLTTFDNMIEDYKQYEQKISQLSSSVARRFYETYFSLNNDGLNQQEIHKYLFNFLKCSAGIKIQEIQQNIEQFDNTLQISEDIVDLSNLDRFFIEKVDLENQKIDIEFFEPLQIVAYQDYTYFSKTVDIPDIQDTDKKSQVKIQIEIQNSDQVEPRQFTLNEYEVISLGFDQLSNEIILHKSQNEDIMFKILNCNGNIYLFDAKRSSDYALVTGINKNYILTKGDTIYNEQWEFKVTDCLSQPQNDKTRGKFINIRYNPDSLSQELELLKFKKTLNSQLPNIAYSFSSIEGLTKDDKITTGIHIGLDINNNISLINKMIKTEQCKIVHDNVHGWVFMNNPQNQTPIYLKLESNEYQQKILPILIKDNILVKSKDLEFKVIVLERSDIEKDTKIQEEQEEKEFEEQIQNQYEIEQFEEENDYKWLKEKIAKELSKIISQSKQDQLEKDELNRKITKQSQDEAIILQNLKKEIVKMMTKTRTEEIEKVKINKNIGTQLQNILKKSKLEQQEIKQLQNNIGSELVKIIQKSKNDRQKQEVENILEQIQKIKEQILDTIEKSYKNEVDKILSLKINEITMELSKLKEEQEFQNKEKLLISHFQNQLIDITEEKVKQLQEYFIQAQIKLKSMRSISSQTALVQSNATLEEEEDQYRQFDYNEIEKIQDNEEEKESQMINIQTNSDEEYSVKITDEEDNNSNTQIITVSSTINTPFQMNFQEQ